MSPEERLEASFTDWKMARSQTHGNIKLTAFLQLPFGNRAEFVGVGRTFDEAIHMVLDLAASAFVVAEELEERQRKLNEGRLTAMNQQLREIIGPSKD